MTHFAHCILANHLHGDVHEVADNTVDFATDVADLRELSGLDLDEGRFRELRQSPGNLGLADTRRPDHENVLGRNLASERLADLGSAPAVPQRDRDRALGLALADDVLVEFLDDLAGSHL